jgi:HlyD family secretion protein
MKRNNQILIPPAGLLFLSLMLVIPGCQKKGTSYSLDTSIIKKGSIINTITATGTLQATTTVQVGTQVSGVIQKLFVDFNSVVKKGQILAEIDKTPLLTAVHQAEASLDDSRSEVEFQKATFDRFKVLLDKKLVAQADFDQVKYNYEKAKSNLKNAQSQ